MTVYRCNSCGATADTEETARALKESLGYGPDTKMAITAPQKCDVCGSTNIAPATAVSPPAPVASEKAPEKPEFCKECGAEFRNESLFCPGCGGFRRGQSFNLLVLLGTLVFMGVWVWISLVDGWGTHRPQWFCAVFPIFFIVAILVNLVRVVIDSVGARSSARSSERPRMQVADEPDMAPEQAPAWKPGTVEFDAEGKVITVDMPGDLWLFRYTGQNRYYSQPGRSLLHATEILMTVASIPGLSYYTVDTPDGSLGRDTVGFYTKAPIKTSGLTLEIPTPVADRVEAVSLTAFGDLLESQATVARLKEAGEYAALVLLMECGHCGYKSPVETQAGEIERQCYCCGAMNSSERWSINVFSGLKMIEI